MVFFAVISLGPLVVGFLLDLAGTRVRWWRWWFPPVGLASGFLVLLALLALLAAWGEPQPYDPDSSVRNEIGPVWLVLVVYVIPLFVLLPVAACASGVLMRRLLAGSIPGWTRGNAP